MPTLRDEYQPEVSPWLTVILSPRSVAAASCSPTDAKGGTVKTTDGIHA